MGCRAFNMLNENRVPWFLFSISSFVLCHALPSCPFVPLSLCPFVPLSICSSAYLFFCPLSLCASVHFSPLSLYPLSHTHCGKQPLEINSTRPACLVSTRKIVKTCISSKIRLFHALSAGKHVRIHRSSRTFNYPRLRHVLPPESCQSDHMPLRIARETVPKHVVLESGNRLIKGQHPVLRAEPSPNMSRLRAEIGQSYRIRSSHRTLLLLYLRFHCAPRAKITEYITLHAWKITECLAHPH